MDKFITHLNKFWGVIKKMLPKPYNKITLLVVTLGGGLISKPLFLMIINALFKTSLDFDITDANDSILGVILIGLALLYNLISQFINNDSKSLSDDKKSFKSHDVKIFEGANNIMSEDFLTEFINTLKAEHCYYSSETTTIHEFYVYFEKQGNSYLDESVRDKANALVISLNKLRRYIESNSSISPKSQLGVNLRLCMQPEWNPDRAGEISDSEKYTPLVDGLYKVTKDVKAAYAAYRSQLKNLYHV